MIKVAIVDDHRMFRDGVKAILEMGGSVKMIWSASDSQEALSFIEDKMPDILLMDIAIGFESGITLTKTLLHKYPDLKVIALSMHHEEDFIIKILEVGAKGYLIKDAGADEMVTAISTVAKGDTYYSNHVSQVLVKHITRGKQSKDSPIQIPLTNREQEVLTLIAQEYSNPQIAKKLFISIRTVDTHRRNLLDKLHVKNTAGLVKAAIRLGLLEV